MILCALCGEEIADPTSRSLYREITGWEQRRFAGGANQITLRTETGRFAHAACVSLQLSRKRAGISAGQGDLFT